MPRIFLHPCFWFLYSLSRTALGGSCAFDLAWLFADPPPKIEATATHAWASLSKTDSRDRFSRHNQDPHAELINPSGDSVVFVSGSSHLLSPRSEDEGWTVVGGSQSSGLLRLGHYDNLGADRLRRFSTWSPDQKYLVVRQDRENRAHDLKVRENTLGEKLWIRGVETGDTIVELEVPEWNGEEEPRFSSIRHMADGTVGGVGEFIHTPRAVNTVQSFAITPNGQQVVALTEYGDLVIFHARSGELMEHIRHRRFESSSRLDLAVGGLGTGPSTVFFQPDKTHVYAVSLAMGARTAETPQPMVIFGDIRIQSSEEILTLIDPKTGQPTGEKRRIDPVEEIAKLDIEAASPSGEAILSYFHNRDETMHLVLWNPHDNRKVEIDTDMGEIQQVSFSNDGTHFLTLGISDSQSYSQLVARVFRTSNGQIISDKILRRSDREAGHIDTNAKFALIAAGAHGWLLAIARPRGSIGIGETEVELAGTGEAITGIGPKYHGETLIEIITLPTHGRVRQIGQFGLSAELKDIQFSDNGQALLLRHSRYGQSTNHNLQRVNLSLSPSGANP